MRKLQEALSLLYHDTASHSVSLEMHLFRPNRSQLFGYLDSNIHIQPIPLALSHSLVGNLEAPVKNMNMSRTAMTL